MTPKEREDFVNKWMESYEPDTFIKNEYGVCIYSAGPSSINLTLFFQDLIESYDEYLNGK